MGEERHKDADYLDTCRKKRNTAEYDEVGCVNPEEANELIEFALELREMVRDWLEKSHPQLC